MLKYYLDALGKSQADHNSIKKFLQIQIPDTLPNYTKLREEAFSLYTDGIDFSKSEQVARAFIKVYIYVNTIILFVFLVI